MDAEPETKLSEISTLWSAVCRAHAGRPEEVRVAQELLLRRYGKAAYRYLRGAVHDPDVLPQPAADPDQPFLDGWRDELLARTWEALARLNVQTGQPFHLVLRLRADHPLFSSAQMAEQLSAALGKPVNPAWVRQTLRRARDKFVGLLKLEIAQTLREPTEEQVEQELRDLGLLAFCR
jgi:RNA polymerase sigma-70 factor (ECF subfamily)